jgi:hypothetical protein
MGSDVSITSNDGRDTSKPPWLRRQLNRSPWLRHQLSTVEAHRRTFRYVTLALAVIPIAAIVFGVLIANRADPTRKSTRTWLLMARLEEYRLAFGKYPEADGWIETLTSVGLISPEFLADARAELGVSDDVQPYLFVAPDRTLGSGKAQLASEPTVCENPEVVGWQGGYVGYNDYRVEFLEGDAFRAVVSRTQR